jgi:molybdopterin molybdotransferase
VTTPPGTPPTLVEPPWPEARSAAHAAGRPSEAVRLSLADATGATLATDLPAATALPPFDTATMDGWAVSGHGPWRLVGEVLAGQRFRALVPGEAVAIATGAQLPAGAHAVLRREDGVAEGAGLSATAGDLAPGRDVRPAGEEARPGDVLLPAGTVITPPVLGLAAAAGHDVLWVHPVPTVDVLVLGDELLDAGLPREGRVRDALGPQAPGWVSAAGGRLVGLQRVPDREDATTSALARSSADVVVSTGGTARGPVDQLHRALLALGGHLVVDQVAVRPGHPMLLCRLPDGPLVVGLPGNPLAAAVAFVSLAVPALHGSRGLPLPRLASAPLTVAVGAPDHAHRLVPARLEAHGVVPLPHHGPAMLRGLALAEVLAVVGPGGAEAGEDVDLLPLPW